MSAVPCQCRPELFFAEHPRALEEAKNLCQGCPVQDWCLEGALLRRETYGVWGGQILVGGAVVASKRGRGRPRKDAAA